MFTQYDHIKLFIQGQPQGKRYVWRLMTASGKCLGVYDHRRKAEQAAREWKG